MNFQIAVENATALHEAACKLGLPVVLPPEKRAYRRASDTVLVRQFVVSDPDGNLLRFSEELVVTDDPG